MSQPGKVGFDHFIGYVEAPSIEQHLDRYRAAGFSVEERTVRHDPGLRTCSERPVVCTVGA
ncbi:MAG: hypothetical protein M3077_03000 [Candidatus Dormibacteraeota bacterium]|nr:hypothetical protein [Candidatus Dormibacteraeota bacterium]